MEQIIRAVGRAQAPTEQQLSIPEVYKPLFEHAKRKNIIYGGRGSAKSHTVARYILLRSIDEPLLVLCTRELQNTIADSVHSLLASLIDKMGLSSMFDVQRDRIYNTVGSRFIFTGVRGNVNEIKSMEGIDIAWVEEAQAMTQHSIDVLVPTVRKEGSILIFTFNPFNDDDPVYQMATHPTDDTLVINANWSDNPFFPEVLRREMEQDMRTDYDKYLWVWEGKCKGISAAQIFKGKYEVKEFATPDGVDLYHGCDWGFSNDPTALVRCFIIGNSLYIDMNEAQTGVDLVDLPSFFARIPTARYSVVRADRSRPETISFMQGKGYNVVAAREWQGSVEDGIMYLRSFEKIYVHPRCKSIIDEFKKYQYRVDRTSQEIQRQPVDKDNHSIDALRYALESRMRSDSGGKMYPMFTLSCVKMLYVMSATTVYFGTLPVPGRTLVICVQETSDGLIIAYERNEVGALDFELIKQYTPVGAELVWLPFAKYDDIAPELIDKCVECGIEPAVPYVLPAENEGTALLNDLFKTKALKVCGQCNAVISSLTDRAYLAEGKVERDSKLSLVDHLCKLAEYTVWRVYSRIRD